MWCQTARLEALPVAVDRAADRAEAAGAGPSTVNCNIKNNFNFSEPPSKRLLTDCLSLQQN